MAKRTSGGGAAGGTEEAKAEARPQLQGQTKHMMQALMAGGKAGVIRYVNCHLLIDFTQFGSKKWEQMDQATIACQPNI